MKCCVKLGKSAKETLDMIKTALRDIAMKYTTYFKWHGRFKDGRQSIEDYECPVRLSMSIDTR